MYDKDWTTSGHSKWGDEELMVWDVTRGRVLTRSQAAYACRLVIRVLQVGRLIPNC